MHSLDDAFFSTDFTPGTLFTPHFGGGLDGRLRPAYSPLGERGPLEELASGAYGSRYQRPYDPDPGEPEVCASAYNPYEPKLPEPPSTPPLFPPPTLNVLPVAPEPRYEDSLMSNEWLDLFLHRLSSPVERPLDQDDPGGLGGLL